MIKASFLTRVDIVTQSELQSYIQVGDEQPFLIQRRFAQEFEPTLAVCGAYRLGPEDKCPTLGEVPCVRPGMGGHEHAFTNVELLPPFGIIYNYFLVKYNPICIVAQSIEMIRTHIILGNYIDLSSHDLSIYQGSIYRYYKTSNGRLLSSFCSLLQLITISSRSIIKNSK